MESPNLHQLQDQIVASSPPLPFYGVSTNTAASPWAPNTFLTSADHSFNQTRNDQILTRPPSNKIQDYMSYHYQWPPSNNNIEGNFSHQQQFGSDQIHFSKIKEELSASNSIPKFTTTPNTRVVEEEGDLHLYYPNAHNCCGFDESIVGMAANGGNFSGQNVFPSINISNLNNGRHREIPRNLEMNLEALDLLTTARFSGSNRSNLGLFKDNETSFGVDLPIHLPLSSPKMFNSEVTEATKRGSSSFMEPKASPTLNKKLRSDPRSSCPPLKVRKEKLGDRISALQQLVAPFGKTDTASVLMEAIGYIKFLQNQVETLSVPYMRSTRDKKMMSRTTQGSTHHRDSTAAMERKGSKEEGGGGGGEGKRDLRSRGLCLVPLSCMSYITTPNDSCSQWSPQTLGFTHTHVHP